MSLTIKPILPGFGAEISGIDIAHPLDEAAQREIIAAMDEWGVGVFRGTGLDNEGHIAFSRIFGHLELAPQMKGKMRRFDHPELFDASNLTRDGTILADENAILHKKGDRLWHTDSSFMEMRSSYSLLLAYEVPSEGGETWFADTRSAYRDLPEAMRARIEGLEATHSLWWSRLLAGFPLSEEDVDARPAARQPLVMAHPNTGRKSLYIASHARDIIGMPQEEGRALIRELLEFATQPQYVFSVKWNPGDLVIWDNLASMHRGGDFDVANERRDMRRTTVREGAAPDQPDDPFGVYFQQSLGGRSLDEPAEPAAKN